MPRTQARTATQAQAPLARGWLDGMGGGDPPLLGAIGLWLGPMGVIGTVIGASLIGLAAALLMLLARKPVAADTALLRPQPQATARSLPAHARCGWRPMTSVLPKRCRAAACRWR